MVPITEDDVRRFWGKVERKGPKACWNWLGGQNAAGYGVIWIGEKMRLVHRISYELSTGKPPGVIVRRRCGNILCVNPHHLTTRDDRRYIQGSHCNRSPLTEADVKRMRVLYERGTKSLRDLSDLFGVSRPTIWKIIHRKTWTHI